jgi:tRNA 2-thiouridine synthesizing protein D
MLELMAKGMETTVCEACAEARGYHKDDTIEGIKRASMDWYLAKTVKTDKLLHIGGE